MSFAEEEAILVERNGFGRVRNRSAEVYHVPGPRPPLPPGDRIRHYLVSQRDFEPYRMEAHGLTREEVVKRMTRFMLPTEPGDGERQRHSPYDQAVWEGDSVVAVVRSIGDGLGSYFVTWIDWPEMVTAPAPQTPRYPPATRGGSPTWLVTNQAYEHYRTCRASETLESLIAAEVADRPRGDLAVWRGDRLAAYIRIMPDGRAVPTILPPETSP